jgi:leucyl aminopeptidase (aminopeptidase T)
METRFPELLEAVRLRYEGAELDPDKTLVILSSTDNYQPIVDAYYCAGAALGANPILITYRSRPPMSGLPDAVVEMASQADQLVDLCYKTSAYSDSWLEVNRRLEERGGRWLDGHANSVEEDISYIINCPPDEKVTERVKKAQEMIDGADEIRVTSDLGMDLSLARGDPKERLSYTHYPPGQVAISPPESEVNGTIYFKGALRIQFPITRRRMVYEPVRIEVEDGKVVEVSRETEVGIMLDDWFKSLGDPNTYQFSHINLGCDPRARIENLDNISLHFNYGGVMIGIGANYWPGWGGVKSKGHVDMAIVGASYFVDGTPILQGGEFTEESGLRARSKS